MLACRNFKLYSLSVYYVFSRLVYGGQFANFLCRNGSVWMVPMEIKRLLARKVVSLFHDDELAEKAEKHFNEVVVGKGVPDDIPVYSITNEDLIVNIIFDSGLLKSKGEARRMIKQGAVKLDEKRVDDIQATIQPVGEQILKVGKRRFLKVRG